METLAHSEVVNLLVALAVMLLAARLFGEAARFLRQPPVVGEIIAGIVLGPTVLGMLSPEMFDSLFPKTGGTSLALDGLVAVSVVMLLFIAGLEVEMNMVIKQRREAGYISFFGMVVPFAIGFAVPWFFPHLFDLAGPEHQLLFSLFLGTSMSITALPVLARILLDLRIFQSKLGSVTIASAMVNDLAGWLIFSVILSMMGRNDAAQMGLVFTIALTLGFTLVMLTVGKMLINRTLPWINTRFAWPGGILSIALVCCFLGAAFTEFIGIHAIFGAFIMGVAFGDSVHFTEKARDIIHQFVTNIFAPLFFVSIGLKVNFAANFDLTLVLIILVIAFIGKVVGSGLGAYWSGFPRNEALAVGFGMNARGAMEIILGLLALEAGLINEQVFVALVIMALITSITSGPLMKYFYGQTPQPGPK